MLCKFEPHELTLADDVLHRQVEEEWQRKHLYAITEHNRQSTKAGFVCISLGMLGLGTPRMQGYMHRVEKTLAEPARGMDCAVSHRFMCPNYDSI